MNCFFTFFFFLSVENVSHTQKGGPKTTSSTVGEREGERSEEVVSGACRSAESSRSSPALDVTSDVDHHLSTSSSLPPPSLPHSASHFSSQQNSKEKITPIDLHVRESRTREEQSNVPKRTSNSPTSSPTESSEGEFFLPLLSLLSLSSFYFFLLFSCHCTQTHTASSFHWICIHTSHVCHSVNS